MLSPPPPPSRPRTRSRGGDDGYMHEEVEIAPDGENGNDHEYGTTNEEPEPDARPAQRNKEANKKKRSKKSKKRSKNCKRNHSSSDSDSSSSSSSSSNSDTDSDSAYHRKNKSKKKFTVILASKHILNLNDKRPAKERHDSSLFLCRPPLHPLMLMVMREGIVVAHLTRLVHMHMATTNLLQMISVGQGTTATTISTALHANLGNFGHT